MAAKMAQQKARSTRVWKLLFSRLALRNSHAAAHQEYQCASPRGEYATYVDINAIVKFCRQNILNTYLPSLHVSFTKTAKQAEAIHRDRFRPNPEKKMEYHCRYQMHSTSINKCNPEIQHNCHGEAFQKQNSKNPCKGKTRCSDLPTNKAQALFFGHDARPSALQKIVNSLLCCVVALNRWSAAHLRQRYNDTRAWQGFACASASRRLHTRMHETTSYIYIYGNNLPLSLGPPQPLPRPSASSSRALRVLPCDAAWWQATGNQTNPDCSCC